MVWSFSRRWGDVKAMRLLEYPMLQDLEQIMVDELTPIQVPPLDTLLLDYLLEAPYATRVCLSYGVILQLFMNKCQLLFDRWSNSAFRCRFGGLG